jgi:hypothetical protein
MIVYRAIKREFQEQVDRGEIDRIIEQNFREKWRIFLGLTCALMM